MGISTRYVGKFVSKLPLTVQIQEAQANVVLWSDKNPLKEFKHETTIDWHVRQYEQNSPYWEWLADFHEIVCTWSPEVEDVFSALRGVKFTERQVEVLGLVALGFEFTEVGNRLGFTRTGAKSIYDSAIKKLKKSSLDPYGSWWEVYRDEQKRGVRSGVRLRG